MDEALDEDLDDDFEDEEYDDPEDDDPEDDDEGEHLSTKASERLKQERLARTGGKTVSSFGRNRAVSASTAAPKLTRTGAPKRILAQQKRRDALELRKMGLTYQKIADSVGYPSASEARKQVLKAYGEIIQEPVEELHRLQVERLNHLLMIAWQEAITTKSMSAINTAANLMSRLDALMGTEAAKRIDVTQNTNVSIISVSATEDEYISQVQRFLQGVNADGSNKQAAPQPVANVPAPAQITQGGRVYPPGMGPSQQPPAVVVIEESPAPSPEPMPAPTSPTAGAQPATATKKKGRFAVVADDEKD